MDTPAKGVSLILPDSSADANQRHQSGAARKIGKPRLTTSGVDLEKGLPEDLDAERVILGAILMDESRFSETAVLEPDDFSLRRHRQVFARMRDLSARNEHIDKITVAQELKRHNEEGPGCLAFLLSLDEGMPLLPHIGSYIRIVKKKAVARRAIVLAQKVANGLRVAWIIHLPSSMHTVIGFST